MGKRDLPLKVARASKTDGYQVALGMRTMERRK